MTERPERKGCRPRLVRFLYQIIRSELVELEMMETEEGGGLPIAKGDTPNTSGNGSGEY